VGHSVFERVVHGHVGQAITGLIVSDNSKAGVREEVDVVTPVHAGARARRAAVDDDYRPPASLVDPEGFEAVDFAVSAGRGRHRHG